MTNRLIRKIKLIKIHIKPKLTDSGSNVTIFYFKKKKANENF